MYNFAANNCFMNIIMRTFKDNIELSLKDGVGEIKMNHATIEFDGANYIITATSSEDSRLTMLSNKLVNNPTCFSDYIGNSSQVVVIKVIMISLEQYYYIQKWNTLHMV
jgi:hypothetical protein